MNLLTMNSSGLQIIDFVPDFTRASCIMEINFTFVCDSVRPTVPNLGVNYPRGVIYDSSVGNVTPLSKIFA